MISLVLLVILGCLFFRKNFIVDSNLADAVSDESGDSWNDSEAGGEIIGSDGVINAIDGGSSGGSDGGRDSNAIGEGEVSPPPMIPNG